ncbi:MAG: ABC transporter ATP-binding protein [Firmicutes bacterium]|nr:ABC transporter ATP-binding protein [Bacillota bacterium]
MIQIENLTKFYGRFKAVDGLTLEIPDGSVFGFVGPNGAGKTTTMKIMSGLLAASGGRITIDGMDIIEHPEFIGDKVGYMPDFFGTYDNLRADEYLEFYAGMYKIPANEQPRLIDDLLELVDLTEKKYAYVDSLSRGMKQRLCLARSLVHDPSLLILDEPASGLDPRARFEMKEILKQLKNLGKTVIISSHILPELAEMCTHVGIIDHGVVKATGSISDIMQNMQKEQVYSVKTLENTGFDEIKALLLELPFASDITVNTDEVIFSYRGDKDSVARLIKNIVDKNVPLLSFAEKQGNLEDVFMELTGDEKNEQN